MRVLFLILLLPHFALAQRRERYIPLPAPYNISNDTLKLKLTERAAIQLDVNAIEVIDNRYDLNHISYIPIQKELPRNLVLEDGLKVWLKKQTGLLFQLSQNSNRNLYIIVQQLWISSEAGNRFNFFKQNLQSNLSYKLEFISEKQGKYYPLKRIQGNIITAQSRLKGYDLLFDSLLSIIRQEIPAIDLTKKEAETKALDEPTVVNYLKNKLKKIPDYRFSKKGMYQDYEDFLQQKSFGDSVMIVEKYDFNEKFPPAAHLGVMIDGKLNTCNKCWGYFTGEFLYYNTGNGLFLRLSPWQGQFMFYELQLVAMRKIKQSFILEANLGNSAYDIIKDYGKVYGLVFQLNYEDGKLY